MRLSQKQKKIIRYGLCAAAAVAVLMVFHAAFLDARCLLIFDETTGRHNSAEKCREMSWKLLHSTDISLWKTDVLVPPAQWRKLGQDGQRTLIAAAHLCGYKQIISNTDGHTLGYMGWWGPVCEE